MLKIFFFLAFAADALFGTYTSKNKLLLKKKLFFKRIRTSSRNDKDCHMEDSMYVRRVLINHIYPKYEKYKVRMPWKCPFVKTRDMYRIIEDNRVNTGHHIKCDLCGKSFYNDNFFNLHINRKHNSSYDRGLGSVCLADYCDIFRCGVHRNVQTNDANTNCKAKEMRKLQRKCEKLMSKCLPTLMAHDVYDTISDVVCAPLTCEKYHIPVGELTVARIFLYTVVSVFSAVFFLMFCCAFIDYIEFERYEKITKNVQREKEIEQREFEMYRAYRFNNNGYNNFNSYQSTRHRNRRMVR